MDHLPSIPVIFTAFANPRGDLSNLTREQNGIQDVLTPLEAGGNIKHLLRTDTDLNAYFDFLKKWENQIVIFHFAGHASSEILSFQNADLFFKPLAEELCMRNKESLKLVFLNGCSTWSHIQVLFDLGVQAVIATAAKIDDQQAMQFSVRFYSNIAQGDDLTLAYQSAANFVKGGSSELRFQKLGEIQQWRGAGFDSTDEIAQFPWGLYVAEEKNIPEIKLIDPAEAQKASIFTVGNLRKKSLWIWQAFTGLATILILVQTINGTLTGIRAIAWSWLLVHFFPGLVMLYLGLFKAREPFKRIPKPSYQFTRWFTLLYLLLAFGTLLAEPFLPLRVSLKEHLLTSFFWLEPFNLLVIVAYWKVFIRR